MTYIDPEMKAQTDTLIERGTQYDLEFLQSVYAEDMVFVRLDRTEQLVVLTKSDNLAFFKNLKDAGTAPLNTYAKYHYAEINGDTGVVLLTRIMQQETEDREYVFNINWQKRDGQWKIVRETVVER